MSTTSLDAKACYGALLARDRRFDGRFFVAVATTGIYCRPVCTARTPRRQNCSFFRSACEAEKAGFRACFRCRPELAPGSAPIDRVSKLVSAAVARIESGALDGESLDDLAAGLGVGARHLRRAMQREIGVSPLELAQSTRLAVARQLILGGALPMTEVAYASGFHSLRRFHQAFRDSFGRPPSEMRRKQPTAGGISVHVGYREPFDFPSLLAFLRGRASSGVELVTDSYARTLSVGERCGWLRVTNDPAAHALRVEVSTSLAPALIPIAAQVRRVFDTDADISTISAHLGKDPFLRTRIRRRPGLRVPGAFDPFELAVRAVLGQQISVAAATTLSSRFVARFGQPLADAPPGLERLTPTAARVAASSASEIAALGMPSTRAHAIHMLSSAFARGDVRVRPGDDPDEVIRSLVALPGIGPWTASYIALRALHAPDAFPDGDLGLRRAFSPPLTAAALRARAVRWRPFCAYAALHLWPGEV
jgi:AraC family transcriptional regulator of adaptative response / DNA-3-methyladenine glycosylase II